MEVELLFSFWSREKKEDIFCFCFYAETFEYLQYYTLKAGANKTKSYKKKIPHINPVNHRIIHMKGAWR